MRTCFMKREDCPAEWLLVDADGMTLGRLASRVAYMLMGKGKPAYRRHQDMGDHVVVVNAEKIRVTGAKSETKTYFRHTGYPGGARYTSFKDLMEKEPEEILRRAVKGMLPHTKLGGQMFRKLHVYRGAEHPHAAQSPKPWSPGKLI
ncbi:MAG: 50S ribosomal protein L13 [Candidatus Eiseniibacteriota bacterium]|nr:MAG: 50S ribosomal protein L13 [Candidatus Eisenbacteria bacterium]